MLGKDYRFLRCGIFDKLLSARNMTYKSQDQFSYLDLVFISYFFILACRYRERTAPRLESVRFWPNKNQKSIARFNPQSQVREWVDLKCSGAKAAHVILHGLIKYSFEY